MAESALIGRISSWRSGPRAAAASVRLGESLGRRRGRFRGTQAGSSCGPDRGAGAGPGCQCADSSPALAAGISTGRIMMSWPPGPTAGASASHGLGLTDHRMAVGDSDSDHQSYHMAASDVASLALCK